MNILEDWSKRALSFANPLEADRWLAQQLQRLNERLDSIEKAVGELQDEKDI